MNPRLLNSPMSACTLLRGRMILCAAFCLLLSQKTAFPDDNQAEINRYRKLYQSIKWQKGPCTATIAGVADIKVPEGYQFTGPTGAAIWNELMENPPSPAAGILTSVDLSHNWYLHFQFQEVGYVRDDEKDSLDADAILAAIKKNTDVSNELRRKKGWPELHVTGWIQRPKYDERTNNLVWAIRGKSRDAETANYDIRLLGRRGVMNVKLVVSPQRMPALIPTVDGLLTGFQFQAGRKYSEVRPGDKVAKYGLTVLIVGGGTVAAAKTGLLAKLAAFFAKMKKAVWLGIAALAAGIRTWLPRKRTGQTETS